MQFKPLLTSLILAFYTLHSSGGVSALPLAGGSEAEPAAEASRTVFQQPPGVLTAGPKVVVVTRLPEVEIKPEARGGHNGRVTEEVARGGHNDRHGVDVARGRHNDRHDGDAPRSIFQQAPSVPTAGPKVVVVTLPKVEIKPEGRGGHNDRHGGSVAKGGHNDRQAGVARGGHNDRDGGNVGRTIFQQALSVPTAGPGVVVATLPEIQIKPEGRGGDNDRQAERVSRGGHNDRYGGNMARAIFQHVPSVPTAGPEVVVITPPKVEIKPETRASDLSLDRSLLVREEEGSKGPYEALLNDPAFTQLLQGLGILATPEDEGEGGGPFGELTFDSHCASMYVWSWANRAPYPDRWPRVDLG